jgi:putative alpha-1,2-mannosidase
MENGKKMEITSVNNNKENVYVKALKVNGKNYTRNYLEVDAIRKGMKLNFQMDNVPNTSRGTAQGDLPYSFSNQ